MTNEAQNHKNNNVIFEKLPSFLVFDCLVANNKNLMHLNFRQRLKEGHEVVLQNHTVYRLHMQKNNIPNPQQSEQVKQNPFITIYMKDMFEVW